MRIYGQCATGAGLIQGCLLSPFLFDIPLDTVLLEAAKLFKPLKALNNQPNFLCYADDIALLAESSSNMQHQMDTLARAVAMLGLKVSVEKT